VQKWLIRPVFQNRTINLLKSSGKREEQVKSKKAKGKERMTRVSQQEAIIKYPESRIQ